MSLATKKSKAIKMREFIGDKVRIHIKDMQIRDIDIQGDQVVGNAMEGFILDADQDFVYMGGNPNEGYTHIIDIDIVGMIQLVDYDEDLKQIIELLNTETPEGEMH